MDREKFAKGFLQTPSYSLGKHNGTRGTLEHALMQPAARWSSYFSQLDDEYLTGTSSDMNAVRHNLQTYTSDANRQLFRQTTQKMQSLAFSKPQFSYNINKLNFHTLNQEMMPYWFHLLSPEEYSAPDSLAITVMQARISVQALHIIAAQQRLRQNFAIDRTNLALDHALTGQATEMDVAVAGLEMVKEQHNKGRALIFLPAPERYESSVRSNRSSDFLLFDPNEQQVRGIQAKTTFSKTVYDQRYVTVMSGVRDLHNYRPTTESKGTATQATPGLIAANFVLTNPMLSKVGHFTHFNDLQGDLGGIVHAKKVATVMQSDPAFINDGEHDIGLGNRAAKATAIFTPSLLAALYKNSTEPGSLPRSA
jgi:hypothetical protein